MTDAARKRILEEATRIRKAFVRYLDDLSGHPETQINRQDLIGRYEELEEQLAGEGPGAQTLPGLCFQAAGDSVLLEREGEEMLMRMEAWNIRLCLRKLRLRGGDVSESSKKLLDRYEKINLQLSGGRFKEIDFCSVPELVPK